MDSPYGRCRPPSSLSARRPDLRTILLRSARNHLRAPRTVKLHAGQIVVQLLLHVTRAAITHFDGGVRRRDRCRIQMPAPRTVKTTIATHELAVDYALLPGLQPGIHGRNRGVAFYFDVEALPGHLDREQCCSRVIGVGAADQRGRHCHRQKSSPHAVRHPPVFAASRRDNLKLKLGVEVEGFSLSTGHTPKGEGTAFQTSTPNFNFKLD